MYVYVTGVEPTWKNEFGSLVLDTRVAVPESSDTEGSSHVTWAMFACPLVMVIMMSSSCSITGGVLSVVEAVEVWKKFHKVTRHLPLLMTAFNQ